MPYKVYPVIKAISFVTGNVTLTIQENSVTKSIELKETSEVNLSFKYQKKPPPIDKEAC